MSPQARFRRGLLKCLYSWYCHSRTLKKNGRLVLWEDILIFLLQFAETQEYTEFQAVLQQQVLYIF